MLPAPRILHAGKGVDAVDRFWKLVTPRLLLCTLMTTCAAPERQAPALHSTTTSIHVAPPASADTRPQDDGPTTYDRDAVDLAWALRQYPELHDLRIGRPSHDELVAWLPAAKSQLYFRDAKYACAQTLALRRERSSEIALQITGPERQVAGVWERITRASVVRDGWLEEPNGYTIERKQGDAWTVVAQGGALSDDTFVGALTALEEDVARFDGEPVNVLVRCDGPLERVECRNGRGSQLCDSCRKLHIQVASKFWRMTKAPRVRGKQLCSEPCPPDESLELARLAGLFGRTEPWRPVPGRRALYRDRARCEADARTE